MGKPSFTDTVKTAAVTFDKVGQSIEFLINYEFWNGLSKIERQFVICHESLHIILNHGVRMINNKNPRLTNQALDIVVNHNLIEKFNFSRKDVDPENKYCWVDTVFPEKENIPADKAFEFYYNLLEIQDQKSPSSNSGNQTVDNHEGMEGSEDIIKELNEQMSDIEKEALKGMVEKHFVQDREGEHSIGTTSGGGWVFANCGVVKKKKKWETVIKKWAMKHMKDAQEEQWARTSRRMMFFNNDLIIPTEAEIEGYEKQKIQVYAFQDTSGSCAGFKDRFFKAFLSLPTDKFNIKMHCFDTQVFETTLESKKLYGFGGTSFTCIENYIQNYVNKHNLIYPKAVWILTDGYGNFVKPQLPQNWYWFLSSSYTSCIPANSKIFMLKDFE